MTDKTNIGTNAAELTTSDQLDGVSKIICWLDDESYLEAGNDTGYTMEVSCPFATQALVDAMLVRAQGYQYQPFNAASAALDPAAELGDAVTVGGIYGGLYSRSTKFDKSMRSDISAPLDMEVDHEYKYDTSTNRKFTRKVSELRAAISVNAASITAEVTAREAEGADLSSRITQTASDLSLEITNRESSESALSLLIQANAAGLSTEITNRENAVTGLSTTIGTLSSRIDQTASEIAAKVSSTQDSSSFGWKLQSTGFEVNSGSETVLKIDSSGAEVKGKSPRTPAPSACGQSVRTLLDTARVNTVRKQTPAFTSAWVAFIWASISRSAPADLSLATT